MASPTDVLLLQRLLREVQQDPTREEAIMTEHRQFLCRMIQEVKAAGRAMPARFDSIVRRYNLS